MARDPAMGRHRPLLVVRTPHAAGRDPSPAAAA
jgi:hypothetical protein